MEEIEIKLALMPTDQRRFMRHPLLRSATARTNQILDNIYFDTPDLALKKYGVALRIRRQGRLRLQTVKLGGKAVAGLSIRPEWEIPYRGRFDFSAVDNLKVRRWLEQAEILNRIAPLFQTRFRRITWHLALESGGEVLVALDRGDIFAGGLQEKLSEVELELSGSKDVAALENISEQLMLRVPLVPSGISKAQRAYALLATVIKR
ncbi:MAG: CYTH domain-containing protein [Rhodocyclaceae bacterium]|nr:CYTH domain-containing protein [Rhodocyclaceae bacterium]MBP6110364.1 CYTH domain-containing protein [Rhodocyclaceae bacterium]